MHTLTPKEMTTNRGLRHIAEELRKLLDAPDEGIIPTVECILRRATQHRASDIHLEPWADGLAVRFRIDGTLHDIATLPSTAQQRITSRIKVLAKMPVYEKNTPQDGRIEINDGPITKALRVSTFPTVHGEKVVLRVLSGQDQLRGLDSLGFSPDIVRGLRDLIALPQGVLLLTGPSSSGKTTTIYALLNALMEDTQRARHIVTIASIFRFPLAYRFVPISG